MNQQTLANDFEHFKGILKQVHDEVKKLKSRQEEFDRKERNILNFMKQQTMNDSYFKGILNQVQYEIKKLKYKQDELERDKHTIKETTTNILQLLQEQQKKEGGTHPHPLDY